MAESLDDEHSYRSILNRTRNMVKDGTLTVAGKGKATRLHAWPAIANHVIDESFFTPPLGNMITRLREMRAFRAIA